MVYTGKQRFKERKEVTCNLKSSPGKMPASDSHKCALPSDLAVSSLTDFNQVPDFPLGSSGYC